ncbi:MAG: transglycosylase domain-containing protein [Chloroflexi bacterium]|nr:transglycosylase domain-containing protein [Chloroflexota bacterium]
MSIEESHGLSRAAGSEATGGRKNKRTLTVIIASAVIASAIAGLVLGVRALEVVGTMPERIDQTLANASAPYTTLDQISPFVREAAISSQDERFYSNSGVDLRGTVRAVFYTLVLRQRQGASTITEQLAKNVYFRDIDSIQTDVATKALALFITVRYSKNAILEMYLNEVIYGPHARGIGQASERYFGVSPDRLTLGQAAYLAGLLNAPGYYADHPEAAIRETKVVLGTMSRVKYITASERLAAEAVIESPSP